jgi:hypothetical protein
LQYLHLTAIAKYGILLPNSVSRAQKCDLENIPQQQSQTLKMIVGRELSIQNGSVRLRRFSSALRTCINRNAICQTLIHDVTKAKANLSSVECRVDNHHY